MKGVRYILHVTAFMQHYQYKSYHRCVSISVSMQKVQLGSIQLAEVVNLASHRTGLTPNMLIAHLWKIAPPPIFSSEPYPPLAGQNSATVLKELKCMVCSNILKQPLELPCRQLACTSCVVERVAASTPSVSLLLGG